MVPIIKPIERTAVTQPQRLVPRKAAQVDVSALVQGLASFGDALSGLEEKTVQSAKDNAGFNAQVKWAQFQADETKRFLEAQDNASESGIGFTKTYMDGYAERVKQFGEQNFAGLSKSQLAKYQSSVISYSNSLFAKADSHENQLKGVYYDTMTNKGLDGFRQQIQNGGDIGLLKQEGVDLINSANRDKSWKLQRLVAWEQDAQISNWKWKFTQNPEQAVKDLKTSGDYYGAVKMSESGGNPNAKNPMPGQTASGLYQFTDGTWKGVMRAHPELGLTVAGKNDPDQQEKAMRAFTADNAKILTANGIETTNGNLYMAHFFGAQGAVNVLRHSDDTKMADIVAPAIIKANPILRGKTVGDIKAWTVKKVGGASDFSAITPETRQKLLNWGEQQQNDAKTARNAVIIQHKEQMGLQIRTDPASVSENDILNDQYLDAGQKDAMIGKLRTEMARFKESQKATDFLTSGDRANPLDTDDRALADRAYNDLVDKGASAQQAAEGMAVEKGIIPKTYINSLRNGLNSTNAAATFEAAALAYRLNDNAQQAVAGAENGKDIEDAATAFQHYKFDLGLGDEEIGRKFVDMNDPERIAKSEALLKSDPVKKNLKAIDRDFVADQVSIGSGNVFDFKLGINDVAGDAMTSTYKGLYEEAIVETNGDDALAKKLATTRFNRSYGATSLARIGEDIVIPYPPEKTYPIVNGSHEYLLDQAKEALQADGIEFDDVYLEPIMPEKSSGVSTAKAARSGKDVPYRIVYRKDGQDDAYPFPFYGDPATAMKQVKGKAMLDQETKAMEAEQEYAENLRHREEFGETRKERRDKARATPTVEMLSDFINGGEESEKPQGLLGFSAEDVTPFVENAAPIIESTPEEPKGGDPRSRRSRRKNR
ncbi:hypothetical protein [uncultured Cohaesibacter sp.]|uniref:hypothetical protein n=1 Tax=uncultured Cohaesibacter sp. TaxID=1002546 RepID=UPI00292FA727|nr:hypothetical protein [uncultured Cohaesibacter sp.]